MTDIPFNRRAFAWVLWIFAGLCLLVILSSCTPMPTAQPVTVTPSASEAITATAAQPTATLTPTPTATNKPNKCRLEKTGRGIADCIRKGMNP
jgi:hypothetical protein